MADELRDHRGRTEAQRRAEGYIPWSPEKAAAWQLRWAQQYRRRWYASGSKLFLAEPVAARPRLEPDPLWAPGEPHSAPVIRALQEQINRRFVPDH